VSSPLLAGAAAEHLVALNIDLLRRALELLQRVDDGLYRRPVQAVFGSSIGAHVRHNLDHYALFLQGLSSGRIDYEHRAREARVESSVSAARVALEAVCAQLGALGGGLAERPLLLQAHGYGGPVVTSPLRELEFLASHTVHHYALVAVLCRLQGLEVDGDFGVAPSTLRHRARLEMATHG